MRRQPRAAFLSWIPIAEQVLDENLARCRPSSPDEHDQTTLDDITNTPPAIPTTLHDNTPDITGGDYKHHEADYDAPCGLSAEETAVKEQDTRSERKAVKTEKQNVQSTHHGKHLEGKLEPSCANMKTSKTQLNSMIGQVCRLT